MAADTTTWATAVTSNRPIIGKPLDIPQSTFNKIFREIVTADPNRVQYILSDGKEYTVKKFYNLSCQVANSLIHLEVSPFNGVCILGANSIEWFATDVGACLAAVIPVGIYVTNKPDIVSYIVNHCNAEVFFVDDEPGLDKFLSVKDQCPNIKKVVIWGKFNKDKYKDHGDTIITWSEFLTLGKDVPDADFETRMDIPEPTSVCKLIYTSGTTGPPKAVMISHDNIVFTTQIVGRTVNVGKNDRMVSFLPASHIAANSVDILGALVNGVPMYFADADALRGSLVNTLKKVRPTILVAVPRVYEKIMEKMLSIGAQSGPVKRAISTWAKGVGRSAATVRDAGDDMMPWGYKLANMLVFNNVKKALGLDQCRLIINTAAPMQKATDEYFKSLDFRIYDLYGMSEATGPLTMNYPEYKAGTSGKPCIGIEMKLHNIDEFGEGELCFRGRNMFVGYKDNDEETKQTMDEEGYIHSGDLARIDNEGFVTITGRAKELIVTAGGENVAPALVESTLISAIPGISRAFAIGDKMKFISAVVVPYMDETGNLIGPALSVNPHVKTVAEAAKDPVWNKYLKEGVDKANEHAISNAAKVKKFEMLTKDFAVETGELTPTMKVKRKIVVQNLEGVIQRMYGA